MTTRFRALVHRLAFAGALLVSASGSGLRAAAPLRLHEIAVNRVVLRDGAAWWMQRGLLDAHGGFRLVEESPVLSIIVVPPDARDRIIITIDAWLAFSRLGPEALRHFVADTEGERFVLGQRDYLPVAANLGVPAMDGKLINLATRGRASGEEKLIGGFVVDEQTRRVLVRAVGPGLAPFGVNGRMADPRVTLFRGDAAIATNGDWSTSAQAGELAQAAAQVGAFALETGSKDAGLLVELAPGNYTAQVDPESGGEGVVLLEIYRVP